jgi:hypothetical protein
LRTAMGAKTVRSARASLQLVRRGRRRWDRENDRDGYRRVTAIGERLGASARKLESGPARKATCLCCPPSRRSTTGTARAERWTKTLRTANQRAVGYRQLVGGKVEKHR